MELPDVLKDKSRAECEEWFLEALSTEPLPAEEMLQLIRSLAVSGDRATALEWSELMQDALRGRDAADAALRLLSVRLSLQDGDRGFRSACRDAALAVFDDRLGRALVESVGFGDPGMPLEECLRRLQVLRALEPGTLCYDKTWGFGVVKRLDDFYKKVTIDFDSRRGHQMTLAYAAETLELISDDHLMARRFTDPDGLARLVRDDPAEVVRIVLRSYGSRSAPEVQDLLVPAIVAEEEWKRFWAAARKDLKADPLVDVPAKRNQPIELLVSEKEYGDAWFDGLKAERDIARIREMIREWEAQGGAPDALTPRQRGVLSDRLAFCIHGSQWSAPDRVARLLMLADRYGFGRMPEGDAEDVAWRVDAEQVAHDLLQPDRLAACMERLPVRELDPILDRLLGADREAACGVLLAVLNDLPAGAVSIAIDRLSREGHHEACMEHIRALFHERTVGPALVLWACTNLDRVAEWGVIDLPNLLATTVEVLGGEYSGHALRANNDLERLFEERGWLQSVFTQVDAVTRANLLKRIQGMRGIDIVQRRSIMARVIKLFPELEHAMEPDEEATAAEKTKGRYTSWRSYNQRREDLRRLVEERIPANSRDIAVARSYGDLSENHEYKTAKEQQGILMRRQETWQRDLRLVQGSDFTGFPRDRAGMGSTVEVRRPNGATHRYVILGEWDGDPELGIISSESKIAKALEGHVPGDEIRLPVQDVVAGFEEDEACAIIAVSGLDERVQAYLRGE